MSYNVKSVTLRLINSPWLHSCMHILHNKHDTYCVSRIVYILCVYLIQFLILSKLEWMRIGYFYSANIVIVIFDVSIIWKGSLPFFPRHLRRESSKVGNNLAQPQINIIYDCIRRRAITLPHRRNLSSFSRSRPSPVPQISAVFDGVSSQFCV